MEFVFCYFFKKVTKNCGCDDSFGQTTSRLFPCRRSRKFLNNLMIWNFIEFFKMKVNWYFTSWNFCDLLPTWPSLQSLNLFDYEKSSRPPSLFSYSGCVIKITFTIYYGMTLHWKRIIFIQRMTFLWLLCFGQSKESNITTVRLNSFGQYGFRSQIRCLNTTKLFLFYLILIFKFLIYKTGWFTNESGGQSL